MKTGHIFADMPTTLAEERFEELVRTDALLLERIISRGHATPPGQWYDQERNEWVLLLSGSAGLRIEGREEIIVLQPGDYLLLPTHCRHRVEWTEADRETVWLALHYKS